jgi:hypothetical protein
MQNAVGFVVQAVHSDLVDDTRFQGESLYSEVLRIAIFVVDSEQE